MVSLVILAAGLGSRFRGDKQLATVGPGGETLFDFTVRDAVAAGVGRVVMIVRSGIEDDVRRHVDAVHPGLDVVYVRQDGHGPARAKPWGTAHAVLAAGEAVDGPFLVANADDYYGPDSVASLARGARGLAADRALLAGFRLDRTLPARGAVSRAICTVDDGGLASVVETHGIARGDAGVIDATDPPGPLPGDAVTSMNLWAFPVAFLDHLEAGFSTFLDDHGDEATPEYLLPDVVQALMAAGSLRVDVIRTDDEWTGITNPDDLDAARRRLAEIRPPD